MGPPKTLPSDFLAGAYSGWVLPGCVLGYCISLVVFILLLILINLNLLIQSNSFRGGAGLPLGAFWIVVPVETYALRLRPSFHSLIIPFH